MNQLRTSATALLYLGYDNYWSYRVSLELGNLMIRYMCSTICTWTVVASCSCYIIIMHLISAWHSRSAMLSTTLYIYLYVVHIYWPTNPRERDERAFVYSHEGTLQVLEYIAYTSAVWRGSIAVGDSSVRQGFKGRNHPTTMYIFNMATGFFSLLVWRCLFIIKTLLLVCYTV